MNRLARTVLLFLSVLPGFFGLPLVAQEQEGINVEYDVVEMPSHWVAPEPKGKGAGRRNLGR